MITKFEKVLAVLLAVWTVLVLAPASASAAPHRKLNVNTPRQMPNLCWVSASVGIMRYLGRDPLKNACSLANRVQSGSKCRYEGGNVYDVEALLRTQGIGMSVAWYPISLESIKYEINHGRPLIFSVRWLGSNKGHVSVIDGYDGNYVNVDYITHQKAFQLRIPADRLVHDSKGRWYKASSGEWVWFGAHTWRYTYWGFRKL